MDDKPQNNALSISYIQNFGVKITTAKSTSDALELFERHRFSYVITDMGRVEGGEFKRDAGIHLIKALRKAGYKTTVVIFSLASGELKKSARDLGARIAKSPTELLVKLDLGLITP